MFSSFVILFREVLEIAVIVSVILAAMRGVNGRGRMVLLGITGGIAGSAIIAIFAGSISSAINGVGQEIFNAAVLSIAVVMIAWTVVWMQVHGRQITQRMKKIGQEAADGRTPLYSVAVVVSLAMWREGTEIVLFTAGIISTTQESIVHVLAGGVAGALTALVLGVLLYLGLITISTKHLFNVTGILLIFLASGMSAGVAEYLSAADIIPAYDKLWDSGWLISQDSIIGKIMHAMFGYVEQPSIMQVIFYITTFASIYSLQKYVTRSNSAGHKG